MLLRILSVVPISQRQRGVAYLGSYRGFATMSTQTSTNVGESEWPVRKEVPDLSGKVALVTGSNSSGGMGFHIAYQLACKNAKVYIGARTASKAQNAIREMKSHNPSITDDALHPFVADLGDARAVRVAAQNLLKTESRLDILVHNAAIISRPLDLTEDGISVSFATNHLGPFVLTNELMPLLEKTAEISHDVRVILVSAASYKIIPPGTRFDSVASFNAEMEPTALGNADFTRYSLSKLANLLFARQLQKNFDAAGLSAISISLHPGLIKTDGVLSSIAPDKKRTLEGRLSPAEGATTALFAATSPQVLAEKEKYGGAYLIPPGVIEEPIGNGQSDELARELWVTSERVLEGVWGTDKSTRLE